MVPIDPEAVRELARFARLELEPDEAARLARELATILSHFARLQALDTSGVTTGGPAPIPVEALRADVPGAMLSQEQALANAPATRAGAFLVPRVIEP